MRNGQAIYSVGKTKVNKDLNLAHIKSFHIKVLFLDHCVYLLSNATQGDSLFGLLIPYPPW